VPEAEVEGQRTLHVAGLDWSVDDAQLHRIFGEAEGLKEIRLVKDFLQRSKGYAYIDFATPEQVKAAAKKFDGMLVHKRPMKVNPSKPTKPLFEAKTIFVKNVGQTAGMADVKAVFEKVGEVVSVRLPEAGGGKHKGYAYVEFASEASVEPALQLKQVTLGGLVAKIARSIPMKDHRHQTAANRADLPQHANQHLILQGKLEREDPVRLAQLHSTTVYVKNFPFTVTEEQLKEHFVQCGAVKQVLICKNAMGKSRGFGFVELGSKADAQSALLLSDSELQGRSIVVSKSQRAITQKKPATAAPATEEAAPLGKAAAANGASQGGSPAATAAGPAPAGEAKQASRGAKRRVALDAAPDLDDKAAPPVAAGTGKVPFRAVKARKDVSAPAEAAPEAGAEAAAGVEEKPTSQPMSNADFRALMLAGPPPTGKAGKKR